MLVFVCLYNKTKLKNNSIKIAELAQGGCISDFRWNSGSSFNGKAWDETLPSDAQVRIQIATRYYL